MKYQGYTSRRQPARWEEAMLCGNGSIGALVMGDPAKEAVIFSHEKMYLPQHKRLPAVDTGAHLDEIRQMLAQQRYQDAADDVVELSYREGYGEKRWTDNFFPLCQLTVEPRLSGSARDYACGVDYTTGVASVSFADEAVEFRRECFVSRANQTYFMRLSASAPAAYRISLDTYEEKGRDEFWYSLYKDKLGHGLTFAQGNSLCYRRAYILTAESYEVYLSVIQTDGAVNGDGRALCVENAQEVLLALTVQDKPLSGADSTFDAAVAAHQALAPCYQAQLDAHAAIHGEIFGRIRLDLGESGLDHDALYDEAHKGNVLPEYYQQIFDAGRYEVLCSSGETPPNLQGVWTGTYTPPWSGDYTQNGNVQTVMAGMLPANMAECMLSFFGYQESLLPDMQENAWRLYRCRGIHLPSRVSTHGANNHFDSTWPMTFWTAGAGWAGRFYYDYWLYTGDDDFFISRALPFMKEAAVFYEDFLIEDKNGKYLFSPSYSPENHALNTGSQACINATMDIAVARELLGNLVKACSTLGIEAENVAKWRAMLAKMPDYMINEDGALKEWACEELLDRYDHRHASHLYPLYYGIAKEFAENPKLLAACRKAYEIKIASKKEEAGVMAFGSIQLGMASCHLGDAEAVAVLLKGMAEKNYYSNFASSHDQGPSIFNADISGGVPGLMLESLAQSTEVTDENDRIVSYDITLLPAVPPCLASGSIRGMRLRGGFILNMTWKDGAVTEKEILNPCRKEYRLCEPRRY